MSKNKVIKILLAVLVVSGGAWWFLKPKSKNSGFDAKEISIKQADVSDVDILIYKDVAGFLFSYPSLLTVEEVEVDDSTIYSSLELTDLNGKKLTLRITDTPFSNTEEWQKNFEEASVISEVENVLWVDIPAIQFQFGVPKVLRTVAVEDGVMYDIENLTDSGGFWDQAHETVLNGFEFDEETQEKITTEGLVENGDIMLVEEVLE